MQINPDEILFNSRYNIIYGITVLITFLFVLEYWLKNRSHTKMQNIILVIILCFLIILFGTRGEYVGTDTVNNIKYFTGRVQISSLESLNDIGLYSVSMFLSKYTQNLNIFLITTALLYIVPIVLAINNLKIKTPLIFFFCLFSFFFFKSMGINIQKQGIAFSFFIWGLSYLFLNKKALAYSLFFIAFLFHASIILSISMFLLSFKIRRVKLLLLIYFLCTLLALISFDFNMVLSNIPIVNVLTESRLDVYYNDVGNYTTGFRFEFWLFNTIFAIIGWITLKNIDEFKLGWMTSNYRIIYTAYMGLSCFFFLMFSARFSDRFGVLSWTLIPFILLPYLQSNKSLRFLNIASIFMLSFAIFLIFKMI